MSAGESIEATLYLEVEIHVSAMTDAQDGEEPKLRNVRAILGGVDIIGLLTESQVAEVGKALVFEYEQSKWTRDDEMDRRRKAQKERA